jgi:hypothetical protein
VTSLTFGWHEGVHPDGGSVHFRGVCTAGFAADDFMLCTPGAPTDVRVCTLDIMESDGLDMVRILRCRSLGDGQGHRV